MRTVIWILVTAFVNGVAEWALGGNRFAWQIAGSIGFIAGLLLPKTEAGEVND